jgi:thymidylate synthase (FAD)
MIKLVYEPKVYLLSKPSFDLKRDRAEDFINFLRDEGISTWVTDAPSSGDWLPEVAGRLCYVSFDKPRPGGNQAFLDRIKSEGHGSVLEHPSWSFIFTGVSRALTHELVRHRHMSYSQLSQRFVDESDCRFVVPWELRQEVEEAEGFLKTYNCTAAELDRKVKANPESWAGLAQSTLAGMAWIESCEQALALYKLQVDYLQGKIARQMYDKYLKDYDYPVSFPTKPLTLEEWVTKVSRDLKTQMRKDARSTARLVLPNCAETKIMVTANARAWRHLIEMRCAPKAEVEIRRLAYQVWGVLVQDAPNLFCDYQKVSLADGTFALETKYRKV